MKGSDLDLDTFYPESRDSWRSWLEKNHIEKKSIWLIFYKKHTEMPSLTWSEAVDEAICFGWIDSTKKTLDDSRYIQYFSKRKPASTWSKINKEKVQQLMSAGLMAPAGLKTIEVAKQNGSWTLMDEVEKGIIPDDLAQALNLRPGAKSYFRSLSKSHQRMLLHWVVVAKRSETRAKRIETIATHAAEGRKPAQFQ